MTTYKITLFNGGWKADLTHDAIATCLNHALHSRRASVLAVRVRPSFETGEEAGIDASHIAHVDVDCGDIDDETIGDFLFEALLKRLVPEYDSLLEIEQVERLSV